MLESGNYNFKKDIILGENGEKDIRLYLEGMNFEFLYDNKDNRYDLVMKYNGKGKSNGKSFTYEIKTDVYPIDTGNLAIEISSWGKPSGLSVTEADYFVYYYPRTGEIWNIKTSSLRDLIKNGSFYTTEGSGDKGSNTKLVLMKKAVVKPYFRVHKIDRNMLNG